MKWLQRLVKRLFLPPPEIPNPVPEHEVILHPEWEFGSDGIYREKKLPKLLDFQQTGVRRAIHRFQGRCLIGDEMGLGKTPQALYVGKTAGWLPMLVVCPAAVKLNWQRETRKFLGMKSVVLSSRTPPEPTSEEYRRLLLGYEIYIINYDVLADWLGFLLQVEFQLIVMDECHKLGNRHTLRTKTTTELAHTIPYRLGLSGTAISNEPSEIWPICHILRPDIYTSFFPFAVEYCRPRKIRGRWVFKGAKNLPQLHQELIENVMIRRRKKDVMSELPKKSRFIVPIALGKKEREEYNHAFNDFISWLRRANSSKVLKACKAEGLVKVGYIKRLTAQLKLETCLKWIDDLLHDTTGKVVVFSIQRKIVERIRDTWPDRTRIIYGKLTSLQRDKAEKEFRFHKNVQILSGNLQACGVGINLVEANITVTLELAWKPTDHSQAEARLDRKGQLLPTFHYYLLAENTIEEDNCAIIQEKQAIIDGVLDGELTTSDMDIYDQFIKTMQEKYT